MKSTILEMINLKCMLELSRLFLKFLKKENIEITKYPSSYPGDEPYRRCPDIKSN